MGDTGTVLLRGLSDLPDELLTQILDTMLSNRDVWNMCLVNHRMNELADAVLHKNILFDQPRHHLTFSESLVRRPRRGSLIQHVRLEYPSSELTPFELMSLEDNHNRVDRLSHAIATMSNLEDLVVSVPETLCKGIGTVFNGPFDLPNLKTCSLFYQREDGGYWDLQENIHIFSHPNLESLTIRHAKLDERGFESLEKPEMTALKELNLLECDINDDALSDLLLHPEALKEITITQLAVPNPPLEESSDDIEDYITALRSAQHSLETITIDFPTLGAENALRLRDFEVLRELQLRDFQLFGQKTPRLHSVGLPSNMEVLEFLNEVGEDEEIVDLLQYTIENRAIVARKWTHFVVPGGEEGLPKVIADACEKSDIQVL